MNTGTHLHTHTCTYAHTHIYERREWDEIKEEREGVGGEGRGEEKIDEEKIDTNKLNSYIIADYASSFNAISNVCGLFNAKPIFVEEH